MIGSIGVDIQGSRAAVCLMEGAGGQVRQGPVGDGRRILIPVAATPTAWGSEAAEAALAALPAGSGRPTCCTPGGRTPRARSSWPTCCTPGGRTPGARTSWPDCTAACLASWARPSRKGSAVIRCTCAPIPIPPGAGPRWPSFWARPGCPTRSGSEPADALLCRWLSMTPELPSGPVLAVVCGETATILGLYSVGIDEAPVVRADGEKRVDAGSGPWVIEIAADALRQCRPEFPARALLGLLDGVDEFAAMLRASTGDTWVEWAGPLSQYMFEPLRANRSEVAARPTVADYARPVASAAHSVLNGVAGSVTLLVGGPGAAWPFVADALAGLGNMWQSGDPTLDLAYGACWWESYRRGFRRDGAGPVPDTVPVRAGRTGLGCRLRTRHPRTRRPRTRRPRTRPPRDRRGPARRRREHRRPGGRRPVLGGRRPALGEDVCAAGYRSSARRTRRTRRRRASTLGVMMMSRGHDRQ